VKSIKYGVAEMHSAQYKTLKRYKGKLGHLAKNMDVFIGTRTGEGIKKNVDVIIFSNPAELYLGLQKFCAAKEAGHSGVDNHIKSILDKLLKDNAIDMNDYNDVHKEIFLL